MNYEDTIQFLYKQLPVFHRTGKAAYKANLNNTLKLDEYFNHPHKKFKSVHIAGTNGKGSVANMMSSVLQEAGYRVGLYTSPHLKSFRERIRVNGKMISEKYIIDFVNNARHLFDDLKPSFFEFTVAMAFKYFEETEVDVAIIEVGLGGRLDSTNIISPELSVITNISFDHTEFLGDTLPEIASEKAGIIKPGIPVVIGKSDVVTDKVFNEFASKLNSEIYFADKSYNIELSLNTIDEKKIFSYSDENGKLYQNLKLGLLGEYQEYNVITALKSFEILNNGNFNISLKNIYSGLENIKHNTGILGRWQILGHNPKIVADTGHNFDGLNEVIKQINNTAYKNLHMVIGFVNDKNIEKILNIFPKNAKYYFTRASIPRALETSILYEKATVFGLKGQEYQDVNLALIAAKDKAETDDLIFVGGSTFVVAEVV